MTDAVKAELATLAPRLRRFARALCGDRDEADELVQTACVKALSGLDRFEPGTRLDSWMFRILRNAHLDALRSRRRRGVSDAAAVDALSDDGRAAGRAEDRLLLARLREAIAALPEEQRAVMALVAIEGRSYREAAEILGTPIGTVMSRLARARARLLPLIEEPKP